MKKQLSGFQFGAIIVAVLIGVIWLLGKTTTPPPKPTDDLAAMSSASSDASEQIGKVVEDFSGPTGDGKTFKLSALKGKPVLLNFWATWCGPCRSEIPDLIKVQDKYRNKGLTIVGMSQDDELKTAQAFAQQNSLNYPVLIAPSTVSRDLGVEALPTSILLDRNGRVVWKTVGVNPNRPVEDTLSEQIDKVL